MGTIGGGMTVALTSLTGTSMEEIRYWQYKWRSHREDACKDGFTKSLEETELSPRDKLQDGHDLKIGTTRINLDELPEKPLTNNSENVQAKKAPENVESKKN